jgi:hypothetical protein
MANERYCPNCGEPNLPDAQFCAKCGNAFVSAAASPPRTAPPAAPSWQQQPYSPSPQPRTIFGLSRKAIVIGIVVVLLLLTLGCVAILSTPSSSPTATPTVKATVAATATVKATATPAATATATATATPTQASQTPSATGFVTLTVNSMTTSSQLGSYPLQSTPSAGKTYLVFDVTLTNKNKNSLYMGNPLYFKLTTSDGTVYQYSSSSFWLDNHLTGVFNTNPGDKVTGQIAFEIPQSAKATKLSYGDLLNGVVTANL